MTRSRVAVAVETVEATMVGAVRGGRSKMGGLGSKEVSVSTAGAAWGGRESPGRMGQQQVGP